MTVFSEGDFTAAMSPSSGLRIQTRFVRNRRGAWAPWITHVALQCATDAGSVEIAADIFGFPVVSGFKHLPTIEKRPPSSVILTCRSVVSVHIVRLRIDRMPHLNIQFRRLKRFPSDVRGLLGTPDNNPDNDVQARDGTVWAPRQRQRHYIAYSDSELNRVHSSWRVPLQDRLFRTRLHTEPSDDSWLSLAPASQEELDSAELECREGGINDEVFLAICVHDVTATRSATAVANLAHFLRLMRSR